MFQIRKIKPEDVGFVMELTAENGINQGKLLSNIESFLICENNHVKCGCGCLVAYAGEGFMNWVAVSKEHRGSRLGSAIVKALLNIAEHKGIEEVCAPAGCADFLKSLGFEETSSGSEMDKTREALGVTEPFLLYKVSLKGYFKPCSQN